MMNVLLLRLAFKENVRIHAHLNNVVSKLFVQLMCIGLNVSVLQVTKVAPMKNASHMSV